MQTDTWLIETSHPERCPLCSRALERNSNVCLSCGFTAHEPVHASHQNAPTPSHRHPNPITPIPARASALRAQHPTSEAGQLSAQNPPDHPDQVRGSGWQHNSHKYNAVSSLSSLSLIIAETPTAPPREARRTPRPTKSLTHIDEIDTLPPPPGVIPAEPVVRTPISLLPDDAELPIRALVVSAATPPALIPNIDEIDTVPEASANQEILEQSQPHYIAVDAASWTAGPVTSAEARLIASRRRNRSHSHRFSPLDGLRWWLLRPGHIEFLLWLVGSILLFGLTFLLLLATVFSMAFPSQPGGNFPSSSNTGATTPAADTNNSSTSSNLRLTLVNKPTLTPGGNFQLQGQGFDPHGQVAFWLDGHWSLLDQSNQPASTHANSTGEFTVKLWLGQGSAWSAGHHQIMARELATGHQTSISITIIAAQATQTPEPTRTDGTSNQPIIPGYPTATVEPPPTATPPAATPTQPANPSTLR